LGQANANKALGQLFKTRNQFAEARTCFLNALTLFNKMNETTEAVKVEDQLGQLAML
jgi:uncharacterized protein HemY